LGNGDGTFQPIVRTSLGPYSLGSSTAIVAGFLDGDSTVDIVAGGAYPYGTNVIVVLKGNGDGTFGAPLVRTAGAGGHRFALADLDQDSHPDLVVTNSADNTISVFRGDATGSFSSPRADFAVGTGPTDLALGNTDGDGKIDAVVSVGSFVSVLRGNGNGTFQAAYEYPASSSGGVILTADFDGDGRSDVAVAGPTFCCGSSPAGLSILLSSGSGVLSAAATFIAPSNPTAAAFGDFDGDGNVDFVIGGSDGIGVLKGLGSGKILGPVIAPIPSSVFADIDEDGRVELLGVSGQTIVASAWADGVF
jgi:hypothetical protein